MLTETLSNSTGFKPRIAGTFCGLVQKMAQESSLASKIPDCLRILDVLLEDFDPRWLKANQKFDISLSSPDLPGIRFSISDFGEKDAFGEKLLKVFQIWSGRYDIAALERFLDAARPTQAMHQTTFGLDWQPGAEFPRLKIYLEELRHQYSKEARAKLLNRIAASVRVTPPKWNVQDDLAALCIDFFGSGEKGLKTYAYRDAAGAAEISSFKPFLGQLGRETKAFYYFTLRHDHSGETESTKLYKVYEAQRIDRLNDGFREIYTCLARFESLAEAKRVDEFRKQAGREDATLYPVLFAVDIHRSGRRRLDAYLSVR